MKSIVIDIIRAGILFFGFIVLYYAKDILWSYSKVLKRRHGIHKKLPLHIVEISISYILATMFICGVIGVRFGEPLSWPTILGLPILVIGSHALYIMKSHLNDELHYPYAD